MGTKSEQLPVLCPDTGGFKVVVESLPPPRCLIHTPTVPDGRSGFPVPVPDEGQHLMSVLT